jgi:septum formation protein
MLYSDGRLHGKPESAEAARQQWRLVAGGLGQLHTGHCVIRLLGGSIVHQSAETSVTTVHFGTPTVDELEAYIDSGEPLKVAGGFTLDGLGGWFIEGVDGDPSSVIGLGLPLVRRLFERAGLSIAELWRTNPAE